MGVLESFTILCSSSQHCLHLAERHRSSLKETTSFALGIISVIVWIVAEIPQIITNYREKSTEGLSVAFLITWLIGDLFNLFGCILEPATLPTQFYMAVLYTIITVTLCSQAIYYGHIYPRLKYKRQLKVETPSKIGQINSRVEKASDAEQNSEFDDFKRGTGLSSPIPLPAYPQRIFTGQELFYQSARYLSKSHTPTTGSILAQRMTPPSHNLDSIEENLLSSAVASQSAPVLRIKNCLCLVSTLTFLGAINLLQSLDSRTNPVLSKPRQEFVIFVGRRLFQHVSSNQLPQNGGAGSSGIGTFLGWAMAFMYLGGRLPQICLNIKRGHVEGLNPLMFVFALTGNATYVASILVSSLEWSKIRPNLPWLIDSGGCIFLDAFILMQFLYFHYWISRSL